jgi:predicted deacetylase
MHYVILRDDDTNALTSPNHLDRLYRPFLDRGLPVNLSTIPEVSTDTKMADGRSEGYLLGANHPSTRIPIGSNTELVEYLLNNPGYHVLQHGCYHDWFEFDNPERTEVSRRLQHGTLRLMEAGFPQPKTFVAPYDKLSSASMECVSKKFRVLSSGWYELGRLPVSWWPSYCVKTMRGNRHWRVHNTLLLSHPGCLLSYQRSYSNMLELIVQEVNNNQLTVLVTHWWEYFRDGAPDEPFIAFLHQTADYLLNHPSVKVIAFDDLLSGKFPLN